MSERPLDKTSPTAVLIEREGRFFFYQPEIGVISSGSTVEDAFEKFNQAKQAHLDEVKRAGLTVQIETPAGEELSVRHDLAAELKLFLVKGAIVLVILVAVAFVAARVVGGAADKLTAALAPLGSISMVDVANKAEIIVRDVQAMPPERKEALRRSIAILAREAEPLAEAWRNPGPAPAPSSSPPAGTGR